MPLNLNGSALGTGRNSCCSQIGGLAQYTAQVSLHLMTNTVRADCNFYPFAAAKRTCCWPARPLQITISYADATSQGKMPLKVHSRLCRNRMQITPQASLTCEPSDCNPSPWHPAVLPPHPAPEESRCWRAGWCLHTGL